MTLHEHSDGVRLRRLFVHGRDHRDDGCGQRAFMALLALAYLVVLGLVMMVVW